MCAIGELEFDGDAENMTKRDKEKMLHRLSIKPSTEKFFRNEQVLSNYIENTIQSYGAIPVSNITNLGHNTSKISNQRSRLGGNVSKVSVRSCDSRLSMTGQQMNAQQQCGYELGYKIARQRRNDQNSPFSCFRNLVRFNREPEQTKRTDDTTTYLKLEKHLQQKRQMKQHPK